MTVGITKAVKKIRWAIIGTGRIANTFASDLQNTSDCIIEAVASRNQGRSDAFAIKYGIKKAYDSYEKIAADPDIDAVYIATPHVFHKVNTIMCLRAKKAILCEKPMAINTKEMKEMIQVAKEEDVFLMEGMWTRFKPTIVELRKLLAGNAIGQIRYMKSDFGYMIDDDHNPDERILNKKLGGGAVLDVGVYSLAMAQMVFKDQPLSIVSKQIKGDTDVDLQSMAFLEYPNHAAVMMHSAINVNTRSEVYIVGTLGNILLPDAWFGNTMIITLDDGKIETYSFENWGKNYTFEIDAVNKAIRDGKKEHEGMTLDDSLAIMEMVDQINNQ
ncbi:MAG: Gfo/Idh/MocA family oxidoreductase [Vallitaleaceae bacterium]|jgi:dihydrodiol dehydrogenase / D-xylose 1-dehydrogenase (NADP)|nr:Gfo/Idh/MocA family oxidoreductase [Vallitaleaceae bacterium]